MGNAPITNIRNRSFRIYFQAPRGSRWYYGNFTFGIMVDSRSMLTNLIFGLGFFDIVFCLEFKS